MQGALARKLFRRLGRCLDLARGANAQKRFNWDKLEVCSFDCGRGGFSVAPFAVAGFLPPGINGAYCFEAATSVSRNSPDAHAVLRCLHQQRAVRSNEQIARAELPRERRCINCCKRGAWHAVRNVE
jgi:hypothetical protein